MSDVAAITHRRILRIAIPIVISNATVPLLGVVDTAVVGQIGSAIPIGAVGIGAIVLTSIYWILGFLRMGTTGLTAQAIGRRDSAEQAAVLTRATLVALAAGLAIIAAQMPIISGAMALSPASEGVEALARQYISIRVYSSPAAIGVFGLTGWLIAQERTRAVLALQLWMNGSNILLDVLFVMGLGWGVQGVAWATFIAEWSGFAFGLYLCRDWLKEAAAFDWPRIFDRAKLAQMASINTDIMIRTLLLEAIIVSFLFLGSGLGDVPLAANQILMQFLNLTAYATDGLAFSAEALVGQSLGAMDRHALRRSAILTSIWATGAAACLSLGFAVLGPTIIDYMTTADAVRAEARLYLPYMVFAPLIGVIPWMLDGIFIGATRGRDMRNAMIMSAAIYGVAVLLLLNWLGNHGLWIALLISYVARGATLGLRYPALEAAADPAPTTSPQARR